MNKTHRSPFWHLVRGHLGREKRTVAVATFAMVMLSVTDLVRPWPLKLILDYVLLDRQVPGALGPLAPAFFSHKELAVIAVSMLIVLVAAARGFFAYLESYHTAWLGNKLAFRLRNELFSHLQRLSLAYHIRSRAGELMSKIGSDTANVKNFFSDSALTLGSHSLTILGTFSIMFLMNWKLALVVLCSFPLLVWNIYYLHHRARSAAHDNRKKEDRIASRINEFLQSVHLVQAFGRQTHEQARFEGDNGEVLNQSVRNARIESAAARSVEITTAVGTCAVILYGSLQVLAGSMSPGTILVFSSYLHGLYRPVRRMVKMTIRLSQLQVSVQRISEVLETEPDIQDASDAVPADNVRGTIDFCDVSFAYNSEQGAVLKRLHFTVKAGQRVAIMGESGAGKSTLIGLILRLYDPQQGQIRLDGRDLRKYRIESLRNQIGVVLQDSILQGTTVLENISYGNLSATRDDVIEAAKLAHAHEFIMQLEQGYDTVLGERGARLSGGQKRRLALARALIRKAPILIMDEPMTGLDTASGRRVEKGLRQAMAGRTCLVITHDERAAANADAVFSLKDGKITAWRAAPTPVHAGESYEDNV